MRFYIKEHCYVDYRGDLYFVHSKCFQYNAHRDEECTHFILVPIENGTLVHRESLQVTLDEIDRGIINVWDNRQAMMLARPTVRFWTWECSGWVRLTLRYGQSLNWHYYAPDDEGYSSGGFTLTYELADDGFTLIVKREWGSRGRDCDGPISSSGATFFPLCNRAAVPAYVETGEPIPRDSHDHIIYRPHWQEYRATQCHDAYAEAAGY